MKRLFTFLAVFAAFSIWAQTNPVKWSTSVEQGAGNQAFLVMTATIADGWHLYAQDLPEGGPIPTSFTFKDSSTFEKVGHVAEGTPHEEFDNNFDMTLKYFEQKAIFKQEIKVKSTSDFSVVGELEFMVCNNEMCMPPEYIDMAFDVKGATPVNSARNNPDNPVQWAATVEKGEDDQAWLVLTASIREHWHLYSQYIPEGGPIKTSFVFNPSTSYELVGAVTEGKPEEEFDPNFEMTLKYYSNEAVFKQEIKILDQELFQADGELEFMTCDNSMCMPPEYVDVTFAVEGAEQSKKNEIDFGKLWTIFGLGFLGGWLALFMPCIFPMIPLTVSFFTKQSKTKSEGIRKAALYGVSIIVIYVVLGMLVTVLFGADALNKLSTNPWFNFSFFALFVVFAISFFGAFEITLPSSWVNKADAASNKGGLIGIFFMAFTLALVSFSCTGPIIGSLLVLAKDGNFFGPAVGMFGFAFALAIPFALFAAFPGWLNSLPKSGGWLNNVKVVLGFLELAFAFKFFSTADLVLQTHILEREMFIAIWVGITFLIVMYLLGVFITPNDSKVERIGVSRLLFATVFTIFGFYMLPGIWGAPVKLISGFPPPEHYAEMKGGSFANHGGGSSNAAQGSEAADANFGDHCPFDLSCFNDFDKGLAYAKKIGKPVMIDFTGWGCVNCRKMEEYVWSDQRVLQRLKDNVVLISLYVDERTKLPKEQQHISDDTGRKIKNIGNKWSEFQEVNFGAVAQPYYIILGHDDLTPLIEPAAYDPDIDKFIDWLDRGVDAFESKN